MSALPHPEAFVRWFRQAAPYVHAFRGRTFVIGFGGELVAEREEKKLTRWRRVAIAACEQCGRNRVPEVREAMTVAAYGRTPGSASLRLLLSPEGNSGLKDVQRKIDHSVTLAVGPEAGFSDEEERLLERAGFVPVRLGQRILRTETAALAALAALNALAGDY